MALTKVFMPDMVTGTLPYQVITDAAVSVFKYMTDAQIADVTSNTASLDVTAAIQAAIDSETGPVCVYLPTGTYKITSTIYLKKDAVSIIGDGHYASVIHYVNAAGGTAIAGDSNLNATTNNYNWCRLENFGIASVNKATDASICVELTGFSYSQFDLFVQTKRANGICYHGQGNTGASPYYNVIRGYMFGVGDLPYTQKGIVFEQGSYSGSNGPNANIIGPFGRSVGFQTHFDIQSGNGNLFNNISAEQAINQYFRFNYISSSDTGTSSGSNNEVVLKDSTKTWTTNAYVNYQVVITSGTGVGQCRNIANNTTTQLTLSDPWAIIPDNTSAYAIYKSTALENKVVNFRGEGSYEYNPNFVTSYYGSSYNEVINATVESLGNGYWAYDLSESPTNSWFSQKRAVFTATITNPGASANIDVYARSGAIGGLSLGQYYIVEWLKVVSNTSTLSDTATVTLDAGNGSVGAGAPSLVAKLVNGNTQSLAVSGATQKNICSPTNKALFLNVATGGSFSATADLQITFAVTLL